MLLHMRGGTGSREGNSLDRRVQHPLLTGTLTDQTGSSWGGERHHSHCHRHCCRHYRQLLSSSSIIINIIGETVNEAVVLKLSSSPSSSYGNEHV